MSKAILGHENVAEPNANSPISEATFLNNGVPPHSEDSGNSFEANLRKTSPYFLETCEAFTLAGDGFVSYAVHLGPAQSLFLGGTGYGEKKFLKGAKTPDEVVAEASEDS